MMLSNPQEGELVDEPLPDDFIERTVKLRVKWNLARAAAKRKKRK